MKKITFLRMLFMAVMLYGASFYSNAQVTLIYPDATPNSTFATIQLAYDAIDFTSHAGAHTIQIEGSYLSSSETFPVLLGAIASASATNMVTIKPAAGAKIVLSPANQTVIASGLTFASGATSLDLTGKITSGEISYLSTSSSIAGIGAYIAGAFKQVSAISGNVLTLPTGTIIAASAAGGNKLFFGPIYTCAIKFNGATYVTIDGFSRTDANTGLTIQNPNCIRAQTIMFTNSSQNNTVKNCIIRGANQTGAGNLTYQGTIYFGGTGTNSGNTIDNNDVCDMNDAAIPFPICAFQMSGAGGTNKTQSISNNNIYNISNQYSGNGSCTFMQFGGEAASVSNSVLSNRFYWTSSPTFQSVFSNFINIGALGLGHKFEGNTIGYASADGTGTTTIELQGTEASFYIAKLKNFTCKNNTVGGMVLNSANTLYTANFFGFYLPAHTTGSIPATDDICSGNQVKDITVNCAKASTLYGIILFDAPIFNVDIKNNVLKNLTMQSSSASIINKVYGIVSNFASSGAISINFINNEVSNFTAGKSDSNAANLVTAFFSGGCSNIFEKNLVYNLNAISSGSGSLIKGMLFSSSKTDGIVLKNNIIRLGTDVSSNTEISAISNEGLTSNEHPFNIYHNSIYIGGTSQTKPSHCFNHSIGANYGLVSLKNNIFSNVRTGGSAVNQVYNLMALADITSSEYNLYQYGSLFATVTTTAPATYTSMSDWETAKLPTVVETGSIAQTNPQFIDPENAITPDLRVQTNSSAVAAQGADLHTVVSDDYYGTSRAAILTPALGAYEFTYTSGASDYYRSLVTGNWGSGATWQSSGDNTNWATSSAAPTLSAASITIQNTHEVTVAANATAPAITVNGGGKLTLNDGFSLSAASFALQSHATNGTATFVDKNVTGGLSVAGTTNVQQYLTSGRNWYVSSPVASETSNVFSATETNPMYYYYEPDATSGVTNAAWKQITSTTALDPAKGFIANMDATVLSNQSNLVTFTGSLNTGTVSTDMTANATFKKGFNLVGNPYPSYLDVEGLQFNSDLEPTYWMRSYNAGYVFDTYNIPGGMSTGLSGLTVSSKIAPMQAFWLCVKSSSSSASVTFTNSMRAHQDDVNNIFRAPGSKTSTQQVLRLQVSNGTAIDEAVLYTHPSASNDIDEYDSKKMSNGSASVPEIFTLAGSEQLTINGLNAFQSGTEMPLGFTTGQSNTFNIKATQVSNFDADMIIILRDNVQNTEQDITNGTPYSFSSDVAITSSRFTIAFRSASVTTNINQSECDNEGLFVYRNMANQIVINMEKNINKQGYITVCNAIGQKLLKVSNTGNVTVINKTFASGVYFVTVNIAGKNTTKKVIIN